MSLPPLLLFEPVYFRKEKNHSNTINSFLPLLLNPCHARVSVTWIEKKGGHAQIKPLQLCVLFVSVAASLLVSISLAVVAKFSASGSLSLITSVSPDPSPRLYRLASVRLAAWSVISASLAVAEAARIIMI
jgi:hypothetical protein